MGSSPVKRKPRLLPITKALRYLREMGYVADVSERSLGKIRRDWCGFADIIAVKHGVTVFVQVTSRAHVKDRLDKVLANEHAMRLVAMPNCMIFVMGYSREDDYMEPGKLVVVKDGFTCEGETVQDRTEPSSQASETPRAARARRQ